MTGVEVRFKKEKMAAVGYEKNIGETFRKSEKLNRVPTFELKIALQRSKKLWGLNVSQSSKLK